MGSALANPTDSRVNYPVVLGDGQHRCHHRLRRHQWQGWHFSGDYVLCGFSHPGSDFNYTDSEGKSRMARLEYTDQATIPIMWQPLPMD